QVTGRAAGYVQQAGVLQLAFDLVVAPAQRVLEVVGDVLVELLVLLVLDLGTRASPQGTGTVDALPLDLGRLVRLLTMMLLGQLDRQGDMVGVFLDDVAQAPAIGELLLLGLEVQHDAGAALGLLDVLDGEVALGRRFPAYALVSVQSGAAGKDFDLVGDDEGAVEAHTKLADQLRVL